MKTELEHPHIGMIATEDLMLALLSQAPDRLRELGRKMATFISRRPGFTPHPRAPGAAAQVINLVERTRHCQGSVEGKSLS